MHILLIHIFCVHITHLGWGFILSSLLSLSDTKTGTDTACVMKINLVDDTALIETTPPIKNVIKKERRILGVRHNPNVHEEMMRNARRSSLVHVCGNVTMNQENGNVERLKFQVNANLDCGNKKLCLDCSLKKQESSIQEKVSSKNCCGNENGMLGFDKNQVKNGKTIQVWVARGGKVQDKSQTTFKDDRVELQSGNGSGKEIVETTISYSRKQMEHLRFLNMEDQNKKWAAIYCQLGPAVKKEYDGLLDCDHHLYNKKKVTAHGILGPMAANGSWNHWYLYALKNGFK